MQEHPEGQSMPFFQRTWNAVERYLYPVTVIVVIAMIVVYEVDGNLFVKPRTIPILVAILAITSLSMALNVLSRNEELKGRFAEMSDGMVDVTSRISALEGTQRDYMKALKPIMRNVTLQESFILLAQRPDKSIKHLRIFAVSSQYILLHLESTGLRVGNCDLLIRSVDKNDPKHDDFYREVTRIVKNWRNLEKRGRIGKLNILSFDFLPTEYHVIADNDSLISGLYTPDPRHYSETLVIDPVYVDDSSPESRTLISRYRERFDALFELCENSHGPNVYSGIGADATFSD
jgi:hypothetical protein